METPLTPQEVRAYERRLRDLHSTLRRRLERLEAETFVSGEDGHLAQPVDVPVAEAALDSGAEIYGSEEAIAYDVRDALDRVAEGVFGRCETCEATIERERLELVPQARLCAGCAREDEARGST